MIEYNESQQEKQQKNNTFFSPAPKVSQLSARYAFHTADGTPIKLDAVERAGLSYVPCNHDQPLLKYAHLRSTERQANLDSYGDAANPWTLRGVNGMRGIQIMTGAPTHRHTDAGAEYLAVIDIEKRLFDECPDVANDIVEVYSSHCDRAPFIVQSKGGGLHLYAFSPYLGSKYSFQDEDKKMLLEIFSEQGLIRLDDRYRILEGSLFDIPSVPTEALLEIYHLIEPVSTTRPHSDPNAAEVVETNQLGELDIRWNADDKSQYFAAAHCQRTDHRDQARETVQFSKRQGGIRGHCFNCGESWWETPPNSAFRVHQLSYKHMTDEEKDVARHVLHLPVEHGWQPRPPETLTDKYVEGQPHDDLKGYAYNELHVKTCDQCGEFAAVPRIGRNTEDYGKGGWLCVACRHAEWTGSLLQHRLGERLAGSVVIDKEYYRNLDEAPELKDNPTWQPGKHVHLAIPMGGGKTTLIAIRARQDAREGDVITVIVVPRVALAISLAEDLNKQEGSSLAWSCHYKDSESGKPRDEKWEPGQIGAVCTLGVLPHLVSAIRRRNPESRIRLLLDEIDFDAGILLANIFMDMQENIRQFLRECVAETGLCTAGATAALVLVRAIAKLLGVDSDDITCYHMQPLPPRKKAHIYVGDKDSLGFNDGDNKVSATNVLAALAEKAVESAKEKGSEPLCFFDSRRDMQVVCRNHPEFPTWDRYSRGSSDAELIANDAFEGGMAATPAIDVGVSFRRKHATTIVTRTTNSLTASELVTTVQQEERNREDGDSILCMLDRRNRLPATEEQSKGWWLNHMRQRLGDDEAVDEELAELLGTMHHLRVLADNQSVDFLRFHLEQTGAQVEVHELDSDTLPDDVKAAAAAAQQARKEIKDREKAEIAAECERIFEDWGVLTENEIEARDWWGEPHDHRDQPKWRQIAHARANFAARILGWDGELERYVEGVPVDAKFAFTQALGEEGAEKLMAMAKRIACAIQLSENDDAPETLIELKSFHRQMRGYLAVHHQSVIAAEHGEQKGAAQHRSAEPLMGDVLVSCLKHAESKGMTKNEDDMGSALIDAMQERHNGQPLSELVREGSLSHAVGDKVKTLGLGRDAEINDSHFDLLEDFLNHYPARIAVSVDVHKQAWFQLARPKNDAYFELIKDAVRVYLEIRRPETDPGLMDNPDLIPPPATDPDAELKKHSRTLAAEQGMTNKEIAERLHPDGASPRGVAWVARVNRGIPRGIRLKLKAWALRRGGKTYTQIAEHLGKHKNTIRECIKHVEGLINREEARVFECRIEYKNVHENLILEPPNEIMDHNVVPHPTFAERILNLLADGAKLTAEIMANIDGTRTGIQDELRRMVASGEIEKPRRGVYRLPVEESEAVESDNVRESDVAKYSELIRVLADIDWSLTHREERVPDVPDVQRALAAREIYYTQVKEIALRLGLSNLPKNIPRLLQVIKIVQLPSKNGICKAYAAIHNPETGCTFNGVGSASVAEIAAALALHQAARLHSFRVTRDPP